MYSSVFTLHPKTFNPRYPVLHCIAWFDTAPLLYNPHGGTFVSDALAAGAAVLTTTSCTHDLQCTQSKRTRVCTVLVN